MSLHTGYCLYLNYHTLFACLLSLVPSTWNITSTKQEPLLFWQITGIQNLSIEWINEWAKNKSHHFWLFKNEGGYNLRFLIMIFKLKIINHQAKYFSHLLFVSKIFFWQRFFWDNLKINISFLIFWGNSILFSTVAAPVFVTNNSALGFPFLHILTDTCLLIC